MTVENLDQNQMFDHLSPRCDECSISKVTEPGETSPDSRRAVSVREDTAAPFYKAVQGSRIIFPSAPVSLNNAVGWVDTMVATNTPIIRRHTVDVYQLVERFPGCLTDAFWSEMGSSLHKHGVHGRISSGELQTSFESTGTTVMKG